MRAGYITDQRLRQRGRAVEAVAQMHGYVLSTGDRIRLYLQLITSRDNQKTSFGAGVLKGCTHQFVDELFQNHFAGERLRDFDHRCEIEMFDRCLDRTRWTGHAVVLPQPRIQLVELPHLSVGSPSEITTPCVCQVEMCDFLEAARRVKAGSQLIGERLVVDEAVCLGRLDRPFVKTLRIQLATFQSGNLSTDKGGAVLEIFGAALCPDSDLFVMRGQGLQMLSALIG